MNSQLMRKVMWHQQGKVNMKHQNKAQQEKKMTFKSKRDKKKKKTIP